MQASLVVASPVVGLACSVAPVESLHFPFHFHSALKAGQALQESLLASALSGAPWWWIRETPARAAQQYFTHLPDIIEVEHKPVAFCEKLSFITGLLQQDNPGPIFFKKRECI